jgi:delta 1-pyrroline-5-carboxylate dehydrogenase
MSESADGKTFYASAQEAGVVPLTPAEIEESLRLAREAAQQWDAVPEEKRSTLPPRFSDDFTAADDDPSAG